MPTLQVSAGISRALKCLAALLLAVPVVFILWVSVFGWNWARTPLQDLVFRATGRALSIGGDLSVRPGWPSPRVTAAAVTFANPPWAAEKQMLEVERVEFSVDLIALLGRKLVFPEVRLTRPVVFLEQAPDGRRTWLLDLGQSDESTRIPIGRLTLDQGQLGYDDARQKTRLRAEVSSRDLLAGEEGGSGVIFGVRGRYKGLALAAHGSGGSVLALHDDSVPYPLTIDAILGHTRIKAEGSVTSLIRFSAIDMHLALRGDSLAQLFPLLGIALPETHAYAVAGRIVHSGQMWRFEKFSGTTGHSDFAGSLQIDHGAARPFVHGELVSRLLDMDDLGPLIGARAPVAATDEKQTAAELAPAARVGAHVLPDLAFRTARWNSIDADVSLRASTIRRAAGLPLDDLLAHFKLKDSVLSVDPLDFGLAGGHLKGGISLDGRHDPIEARARMVARHLLLARLFPGLDSAKTNVGQFNGEFDLAGKGNSVGRMLATADGKVGLVLANGEISRLLMEEVGLHLMEILQLKITGDKAIKLHCAVAAFDVKGGVMESRGLLVDTEVSTITGSGRIDLGRETLDLTLEPKTRNTSPVALRSPIYVKGSFSSPEVAVDKTHVVVRGAGAVALGLVSPLLALIPLIEMGPGVENECGRLIKAARTHSSTTPTPAN